MNEEVKELTSGLSGSYWNYRWAKIVFTVPKFDDNLNRIEGEFEERILDAAAKKVLLIKDGKIKELDEYMDKSEILANYRKGQKDGKD